MACDRLTNKNDKRPDSRLLAELESFVWSYKKNLIADEQEEKVVMTKWKFET